MSVRLISLTPEPLDNHSLVQARQRHRSAVFAVLAAIVGVDQGTKWWAWRHIPKALINIGGDPLTGPMIDHWYAARIQGALLDFLDAGLLAGLLLVLMNRLRQPALLLSATVMLGGWMSNLLDRLGLHYFTAPGSARGVVDFIHLGWLRYNVADICIVAGTVAVLGEAIYIAARRNVHVNGGTTGRLPWRWPGVVGRLSGAAVALGLLAVVAIGATNDNGVTAPAVPLRTSQDLNRM